MFKKVIALFTVFLMIISAGSANVLVSSINITENAAQESFSYIDFLKTIDLYVKSASGGNLYIESPDLVKNLIRQNFTELQKIDFHKISLPRESMIKSKIKSGILLQMNWH